MAYTAGSIYSASLGAPNEGKYRSTPAGQRTVPDIIHAGTEIRTSYNTGGIVKQVTGPYQFDDGTGTIYQHYSVSFVAKDKWGKEKASNYGHINELVAVDGRILKLFEANTDEVCVIAGINYPTDRKGQLSLF